MCTIDTGNRPVNTSIIDANGVKIDEFSPVLRSVWVETLFDALNLCSLKKASNRRAVLPYQIQTMERLPDRAVLLNRWYKPLGMLNNHDWEIPYEEHPEAHIHVELFKLARPLLNAGGYFFKDNSAPWVSTTALRDYRTKIKDLLSPWINPRAWS